MKYRSIRGLLGACFIVFSTATIASPFVLKGVNIDDSIEDLTGLLTEVGGSCTVSSGEQDGEATTILKCEMADCLNRNTSSYGGEVKPYCLEFSEHSSLTLAGQNVDEVIAIKRDRYDGVENIRFTFDGDDPIVLDSLERALAEKFGQPRRRIAYSHLLLVWSADTHVMQLSHLTESIVIIAKRTPVGTNLSDL